MLAKEIQSHIFSEIHPKNGYKPVKKSQFEIIAEIYQYYEFKLSHKTIHKYVYKPSKYMNISNFHASFTLRIPNVLFQKINSPLHRTLSGLRLRMYMV
jgi:hypothetical protein